MLNTQQLGNWAEQSALHYLQQRGFEYITHHYQCRFGEIDLIVKQNNLLAFVEVKARSTSQYGSAQEMLTPAKQRKIIKTALHFLEQHSEYEFFEYRFDFIAIQFLQYQEHLEIQQLDWIENAFLTDEYA